MVYRSIPDEAVEAGKPASPYLARAYRDNDEAIANASTAIAVMLDDAVGHVHGVGARGYAFTFTDYVKIIAGVNDKVPFRFGSDPPTYATASYSATITPGNWSIGDLAGLIQSAMRTAVDSGTPAAVPISVAYDSVEGSVTRGLIIFQHTGSSEPPDNVFELLFGTGTGASTGVARYIGFPKVDQKRGFAYRGSSGFSDGHQQDYYVFGEGGLLSTDAWVAGAFNANKIGPEVISTRCIQNGAVEGSAGGDKIHDNTLDGDKTGPPVTTASSATTSIGAGGTQTLSITMPNGGAGRTPQVVPYSTTDCLWAYLSIQSLSHTGGGVWNVAVKNLDLISHNVGVVAY